MSAVPVALAATDVVETEQSKLWVRRGAAPTMPHAHRHDDLEINIVLDGHLDYLFGGSRVRVQAGQVALFWAATPHRLIGRDAEATSDVCWVQIPLPTALSWGLPRRDVTELLMNSLIVVGADAVARDVEAMFESWRRELDTEEGEAIAYLEVQALLRRALQHQRRALESPVSGLSVATVDGASRVTTMAQFVVAHFREPISVADIADAAHLSPSYAMTLFRETVGTTIGGYLTRCRVAEAQRLLITTSMTTLEIAHASGFGSQSSFYDHFTRVCGVSPGSYRRRLS